MAKRNLSEYWQEMAAKAGLSEAQIKAVGESLGDETVAKAFAEAFVPVPDHHSTLDKKKSEYEKQVQEALEKTQQYTEWYEKQAKPAYEQNLKGVSSLARYQELYGPLDAEGNSGTDNGNEHKQTTMPANTLTKEEFEEKMREFGNATVTLTKSAMRVAGDYLHRFKEPMSDEQLTDLENVATSNGLSLDKAYEMWISPRVKEAEMEALKTKYEREKEEAVRDALSQRNLPVDSSPPEHPFFNPTKVEKDATPQDVRQQGKDAFMKAFTSWGDAS